MEKIEMNTWINAIGLVCDIFGAIWLFIFVSKGLKPINNLEIQISAKGGYVDEIVEAIEIENAFKKIQGEINTIINSSNEQNNRIHKKSIVGLVLILLGFILQLIASFMS